MLGSPGLNDAVMHMLQACAPHRRLLPAGFGALTVSGAEVRGAVQVRAEREPGPAAGWRVTAVDAAGHTVAALSGLRLLDVGPLEASAPWHPTLLAAALEGWAAEFGLDPALRVTVSCGQPGQDRQPPADGVPWLDASTGLGPLAGFQLTARASMPVACYWASAQAGPGPACQDRWYRCPQTARARRWRRAAAATKTRPGWPSSCGSRLASRRTGWRPGCAPSPHASRRRAGRPGRRWR